MKTMVLTALVGCAGLGQAALGAPMGLILGHLGESHAKPVRATVVGSEGTVTGDRSSLLLLVETPPGRCFLPFATVSSDSAFEHRVTPKLVETPEGCAAAAKGFKFTTVQLGELDEGEHRVWIENTLLPSGHVDIVVDHSAGEPSVTETE